MKKQKRSKMKLRICILSCLFVGIISMFVGTVFQDWVQIVANKSLLAELNAQYDDLLDEEESLTSEVTKLHDIDYVARYAREKYMYSLPNEIIIKLPGTNN